MKNTARLRGVVVAASVLFLGVCLIYILWGKARSFHVPSLSAPSLECTEPLYDFGEVDTGDAIDHVFTLHNSGSSNLEITSARPECGCTVFELPEKIVSPGGSVPVNVKLSLKNLRGAIEKRLVLSLNDPKRPTFILTLKGKVRSSINLYPEAINFGNLAPTAEVTQMLELKPSLSGPLFRVVKVFSDSPNLAINQESLPDKPGFRIFLQTKAPLPAGPFHTVVRVQTDHPKEPEIIIPVRAVVEKTAGGDRHKLE